MKVKIDEVQPGMELTEDVSLPSGSTLLKASTKLTEELIATLNENGIQEIAVREEGSPNAPDPEARMSPTIRATAGENAMTAELFIDSTGNSHEELCLEDIARVLAREGIVVGIDKNLLAQTVENWEKTKEARHVSDIAKGVPAVPGREGRLEFDVKHLTNANQLDAVRNATYCWQLGGLCAEIQKVDSGTVLAHRLPDIPPTPGKSVRGETLHTDEIVAEKVTLDSTVEVSRDGRTILARQKGVAYFVGSKVGVAGISFDGSAEITVSKDCMRADLVLRPAMEGGKDLTDEAIIRQLGEKGVVSGIDSEKLKKILAERDTGVCSQDPVTIATATTPVNGEDGRVEFLFDAESSLRPKVNADGSVDFKDVGYLHSVSAGTKLARLMPATKGTPGKDVTGAESPCEDGVPAELPIGANTASSPEDGNVLVAEVDGIVRYNGSTIEVSEALAIEGDVDFSTGNVKYEKCVSIGGDVKSGFKVECGGDLEVSGTVEDAQIHVKGGLICRQGFVGHGKGTMDVMGDVGITFAKNQTIRCHSSVFIAKEALNCNILARKSITVAGDSLSVAGGTLAARDSIVVKVVGNDTGVTTNIEVGSDFTLVDEMAKVEQKLTELNETRAKLAEADGRYAALLKHGKKLSPRNSALHAKLRNSLKQFESETAVWEKRKQDLTKKMQSVPEAFIKIERSAMPGTVVSVCGCHHVVREEVIGPKTVRLVKGGIEIA